MPETLTDTTQPTYPILCSCGWGMLCAYLHDLETLEDTGCPTCGLGFTVEEGWAA